MNYSVNSGIINSPCSIPHLPRWFAQDRTVFGIDKKGIIGIDYWNKNTNGSEKVMYADFWGGIRFYIEKDKKTFLPEMKNTKIYPFGFFGQWEINGFSAQYSQVSVHDSIVICLKPLKDDDFDFKMQFYNSMCMQPHKQTDIRYVNRVVREWSSWEKKGNMLCNSYKEEGGATAIAIGSNAGFSLDIAKQLKRYTLKIDSVKKDSEYVFVISLDISAALAEQKYADIIENYKKYTDELCRKYDDIAKKMPKYELENKSIENFMSLAPLYHESLKINEYPGAVRAKTTYYWVWGWDGITSNEASVYWGDLQGVKNLLDFYMNHSDHEKGIAHAYTKQMLCKNSYALANLGMYISLLYLYFINGGDISEYYDFAVKIFSLVCKELVGETGMFREKSLFPDYPAYMKETGNDISGFNNTVFYCGLKAMEILAESVRDKKTAAQAYEIYSKIEDNFIKLFFDKEKGYIVSSIDSDTLEKRNCFNSNSVKWENNFCANLVRDMDKQAIKFFEDNIVTNMGLRETPAWCDAYDADANQLHCWWPVTGEYFARLINKFDKQELIDKWQHWVAVWTDRLLCPEGISCYEECSEPDLDGWNCQSGTWQAYSMRGWYQAAVHSLLGIEFDYGGIIISPHSGKPMKVENLHWADMQLDIEITGKGKYIDLIDVNGEKISSTCMIPYDLLKMENKITVTRAENPHNAYISKGYGIKLTDYRENESGFSGRLTGYGHQQLVINCIKNGCVFESQTESIKFSAGENVIKLDFTTDKEFNFNVTWRRL